MMLTATQAAVLARLRGQHVTVGHQHRAPGVGGLKVRDLAQDLRVSRQAVVGALGELIARGLVVRMPSLFKDGPATYAAVDFETAFPALSRLFEAFRIAAFPARGLRHLAYCEGALAPPRRQTSDDRQQANARAWGFAK